MLISYSLEWLIGNGELKKILKTEGVLGLTKLITIPTQFKDPKNYNKQIVRCLATNNIRKRREREKLRKNREETKFLGF